MVYFNIKNGKLAKIIDEVILFLIWETWKAFKSYTAAHGFSSNHFRCSKTVLKHNFYRSAV